MTESIVSLRAVMTATGRTASASAAASAGAAAEQRREPGRRAAATASVPASAAGSSSAAVVEAEQLRARDLQPEVDRRLVDRDARARLERPDEQGVPRRAHAPHGRVVERVRLRRRRARRAAAPPRRQDRGERAPAGDRPEAVRAAAPLRRPPFAEAPCGAGATRGHRRGVELARNLRSSRKAPTTTAGSAPDWRPATRGRWWTPNSPIRAPASAARATELGADHRAVGRQAQALRRRSRRISLNAQSTSRTSRWKTRSTSRFHA